MTETINDILTVKDVCKVMKMGKNTVYSILKNGKLKSIRIGKKYYVPKLFLNDFINKYR